MEQFKKGEVVFTTNKVDTISYIRSRRSYCKLTDDMQGTVLGYANTGKVAVQMDVQVWDYTNADFPFGRKRSMHDNGCHGKGKVGYCVYLPEEYLTSENPTKHDIPSTGLLSSYYYGNSSNLPGYTIRQYAIVKHAHQFLPSCKPWSLAEIAQTMFVMTDKDKVYSDEIKNFLSQWDDLSAEDRSQGIKQYFLKVVKPDSGDTVDTPMDPLTKQADLVNKNKPKAIATHGKPDWWDLYTDDERKFVNRMKAKDLELEPSQRFYENMGTKEILHQIYGVRGSVGDTVKEVFPTAELKEQLDAMSTEFPGYTNSQVIGAKMSIFAYTPGQDDWRVQKVLESNHGKRHPDVPSWAQSTKPCNEIPLGDTMMGADFEAGMHAFSKSDQAWDDLLVKGESVWQIGMRVHLSVEFTLQHGITEHELLTLL